MGQNQQTITNMNKTFDKCHADDLIARYLYLAGQPEIGDDEQNEEIEIDSDLYDLFGNSYVQRLWDSCKDSRGW